MRITSKGQVTIPQHIRKQAGLLPSTEVEFHYVRGKVTLNPIPAPSSKGAQLITALQALGKTARRTPLAKLRTDEVMRLMRGKE